jgi:hypothetical protein
MRIPARAKQAMGDALLSACADIRLGVSEDLAHRPRAIG